MDYDQYQGFEFIKVGVSINQPGTASFTWQGASTLSLWFEKETGYIAYQISGNGDYRDSPVKMYIVNHYNKE